ncbi:choice-of-anchor Q domain-containing protein [Capilliphycus salinus ALCB114379]|uniref:choice-of-anchor Q domain-containing protein n=1 Tax=Capilliphycus salinus TaxID=2768948 RepID=UPI0039A43394
MEELILNPANLFNFGTRVTNTSDSGPGSLREAINFANLQPGADIITFEGDIFNNSFPHVITLESGELTITDSLTIDGDLNDDGIIDIIIDANQQSRVFNIDDGNGIADTTVTLEGLTIRGGNVIGLGGGILNRENLTVRNSHITQNSAITSGSVIGEGGGINNDGGMLTVENSTLSNNSATRFSGAIDNDRGILNVSNSTISGNTSASSGGIATHLGTATISNSTIADNSGIGLVNGSRSSTTVTSTIIAENGRDLFSVVPFTSGGHNLIGNGTGATGFTDGINNDWVGTSANPIDPLIGPLEDNGGGTPTHELFFGSPALNRGSNPNNLEFDQRGEGFPRLLNPINRLMLSDDLSIFSNAIDIGALEVEFGGIDPEILIPIMPEIPIPMVNPILGAADIVPTSEIADTSNTFL